MNSATAKGSPMGIETVVIAGSGPAWLTAAIYAARAGLKPLVLEGLAPEGQLTVSEAVENYPGFPESLPGSELMSRFRKQAQRFDFRFHKGNIGEISRIDSQYDLRVRNETIRAKSVIIATGAQARRLDVLGEKEFYGRGISGCVTCDGTFFKDKKSCVGWWWKHGNAGRPLSDPVCDKNYHSASSHTLQG
jgi:thioredoxin reductase (NADPH)